MMIAFERPLRIVNGISFRIGDEIVYGKNKTEGTISQFGGTVCYVKVPDRSVLQQVSYSEMSPKL